MPRLHVLRYGALLRALKRIGLQPIAICEETTGKARKRCDLALEWQSNGCRHPLDHAWAVAPVRAPARSPTSTALTDPVQLSGAARGFR